MAKPTIRLVPLKYPNGSVLYTSPTDEVTVLGSVNGPIEVTRRDTQKPEEATLEVIVKPGVGSSGVGERYVESIIRGVLNRIILMRDKNLARKGIVVTLLVTVNKLRDGKIEERGGSYLPILPSLLNAALIALVSAAIPMSMIYVATVISVSPSGELVCNPSATDLLAATSTHVFAFSSKGHLLVNESDGSFNLPTWEKAHDIAESLCLSGMESAKTTVDGDIDMESGSAKSLAQVIRDAIEDRIREDSSWKLVSALRTDGSG